MLPFYFFRYNNSTSNDGTAGDVTRPIIGVAEFNSLGHDLGGASVTFASGAFKKIASSVWPVRVGSTPTGSSLGLDSGLAVPVGPENSVRTLSVIYWRRVPDPL